MKFKVKGSAHVYITPHYGRVDLRFDLPDELAMALYKDPSFPYLGLTKNTIPLLKKEKVTELTDMVDHASLEDLNILMQATKNKALLQKIEKKILTLSS